LKPGLIRAAAAFLILICFVAVYFGCEESSTIPEGSQDQLKPPPVLTIADVQRLLTQAVDVAEILGEKIVVGVLDREGNILGTYRMTGSLGLIDGAPGPPFELQFAGALEKARTVCYLSSNQFAITTVTACFLTRNHFPPGISNLPAGPLYGVTYSSQNGSDILTNKARGFLGAPGLTGVPGGVPIFKNGLLAGGLGISGGSDLDDLTEVQGSKLKEYLETCAPVFVDERIALAAVKGFEAPKEKRSDTILAEGIRLRFKNIEPPRVSLSLTFADLSLPTRGAVVDMVRATPGPFIPVSGEIVYTHPVFGPVDYSIKGSVRPVPDTERLTEADVRRIVKQCVDKTAKTRAAVRRPLGVAAQEFISVCDLDGRILALWRTPDALLDAIDAVPQKARTAVAYSDPSTEFGAKVRDALGLPAGSALAVSTRAVNFLAQDFFPPGIDTQTLGGPVEEGPLFEGREFAIQRNLIGRPAPGGGNFPYGNGITVFGGGFPLYKNGHLVGGVGVSGDGTEQSDYIGFAGTIGYEPPEAIRVDQFFYKGVRIAYAEFPRRPDLD